MDIFWNHTLSLHPGQKINTYLVTVRETQQNAGGNLAMDQHCIASHPWGRSNSHSCFMLDVFYMVIGVTVYLLY